MNQFWDLKGLRTPLSYVGTAQLLQKLAIDKTAFFMFVFAEQDIYVFQGKFDLGHGLKWYNLEAFSSGQISVKSVFEPGHVAGLYDVSEEEFTAGIELAKKLCETLDEEMNEKLKKKIDWIKKTWEKAERKK